MNDHKAWRPRFSKTFIMDVQSHDLRLRTSTSSKETIYETRFQDPESRVRKDEVVAGKTPSGQGKRRCSLIELGNLTGRLQYFVYQPLTMF
jgi:hypothetical protein